MTPHPPPPEGRMFPLQSSHKAKPGPREIPWAIGEKAWQVYAAKHGYSQSCERMAERGGFSWGEMDMFYPPWRDEVDEVAKMRSELARLRAIEKAARDVAIGWGPGIRAQDDYHVAFDALRRELDIK